MMKKEWAAVCILVLIFTASLINVHKFRGITDSLISLAEETQLLSAAENWDGAEETVLSAISLWSASRGYTHIFIRHTEIDKITDALEAYQGAVLSRDGAACESQYRAILKQLESVIQMETVTPGSVF